MFMWMHTFCVGGFALPWAHFLRVEERITLLSACVNLPFYCFHACTQVLAILTSDGFVDSADGAALGGPCGLVLNTTSFYAEQGGQTCDTGSVAGADGTLDVQDAQARARVCTCAYLCLCFSFTCVC